MSFVFKPFNSINNAMKLLAGSSVKRSEQKIDLGLPGLHKITLTGKDLKTG